VFWARMPYLFACSLSPQLCYSFNMSVKNKDLNEQHRENDIQDDKAKLPATYHAPKIESQDLLAFAASCNGSTAGKRKASVGAPNFCRSNRLNS
tara:strand:+ start:12493 stop:12774 length:282 start_codon:yes stop_codon:yes gene_type:complete